MVNAETHNTAMWLRNHSKGMEQTILRIWGSETPDGYNLKAVDWFEISDSWLNEYGMDWEQPPP